MIKGVTTDFCDALRDGDIPAGASVLDQNAVLNDKILLVFHDDHHASHNMVCIKREENMQTNGRLS